MSGSCRLENVEEEVEEECLSSGSCGGRCDIIVVGPTLGLWLSGRYGLFSNWNLVVEVAFAYRRLLLVPVSIRRYYSLETLEKDEWSRWSRIFSFFLFLSVDRIVQRMISFSINIFALVFGGISLMFQRGPVYLWTSVKCRFRPGQIYNGRRVLFGSKVGSSPSPRSSRWNLNRRLSRRCFFSVDRKEGKFRLADRLFLPN